MPYGDEEVCFLDHTFLKEQTNDSLGANIPAHN